MIKFTILVAVMYVAVQFGGAVLNGMADDMTDLTEQRIAKIDAAVK